MILRGKREQLEEKAAWILVESIQALLQRRAEVVVAVPGGRSVGAVFANLRPGDLDWRRVHFFMVDERLVPLDHPDSNFNQIAPVLGQAVPAAMLHPFSYDPEVQDCGLIAYECELQQFGGRFDVVLVSSGEDGHIASLFPGHAAISTTGTRYMVVDHSPKPPSRRISATAEMIGTAEVGVLLFFGLGKGAALKQFLNPHLGPVACPAKLISRLPQHYILTDLEVTLP